MRLASTYRQLHECSIAELGAWNHPRMRLPQRSTSGRLRQPGREALYHMLRKVPLSGTGEHRCASTCMPVVWRIVDVVIGSARQYDGVGAGQC